MQEDNENNGEKNKMKKKYLMDVVLIRLILIGLLIVVHALAIFSGAWPKPFEGLQPVRAYWVVGNALHCFRLEAMVFISGLLLGYTLKLHPERLCFQSCILKKVRRILLPCWIFGVFYFLMFEESAGWLEDLKSVLWGVGHLWFLTMLFWCFCVTYILEKYFTPPHEDIAVRHRKTIVILAIALMAGICNFSYKVPFGFTGVGKYYFFFYWGFSIIQDRIPMFKGNTKNILIALVCFIVCVAAYINVPVHYPDPRAAYFDVIQVQMRNNCWTLPSSVALIYLFYTIANRKAVSEALKKHPLLITLSGYCYGVYIFQEFILKVLYFKTDFPLFVNAYLLPWVATFITLVLSLTFCHFTLKTRIGRYLIG